MFKKDQFTNQRLYIPAVVFGIAMQSRNNSRQVEWQQSILSEATDTRSDRDTRQHIGRMLNPSRGCTSSDERRVKGLSEGADRSSSQLCVYPRTCHSDRVLCSTNGSGNSTEGERIRVMAFPLSPSLSLSRAHIGMRPGMHSDPPAALYY